MIRDLLCPSSEVLELFEDSTGEIVVNNLVEVETTSTSEVMKLLQRGNWQRTCEPTAANKTSSRSHAILKVSRNAFIQSTLYTFAINYCTVAVHWLQLGYCHYTACVYFHLNVHVGA